MNETVKTWLEGLINKEIGDVLDDIEGIKIWCLKASDKEALQIQLDNLSLDNELSYRAKDSQESYRERRTLIPLENLYEKSR
jgi:hypothetical protein